MAAGADDGADQQEGDREDESGHRYWTSGKDSCVTQLKLRGGGREGSEVCK